MFIDLLRHGETIDESCFRGHTDDPLSETGWQQMLSALDQYKSETVITSPLIRCAKFATQWTDQKNITAKEMSEFKEINFGDWDGLTAEQIKVTNEKELKDFWSNPAKNTPPNGESLVDFQQRVMTGLQNLITNHKDQNILLITHGGVIRIIIAHVLSMPLNKLLSLELPLASMSRIRITFDDHENQYFSLVSHAKIPSGEQQ